MAHYISEYQARRLKWIRVGTDDHWKLWRHLGGVHRNMELAVLDICNAKAEEDGGVYADVIVPNPHGNPNVT